MADIDKAEQAPEILGALKYKELQALAKNRGIKANLSKSQLIQQLRSTQTPGLPDNLQDAAGSRQDEPDNSQGDPHEAQNCLEQTQNVCNASQKDDAPPQAEEPDQPEEREEPEEPVSATRGNLSIDDSERRKSERLLAISTSIISTVPETTPAVGATPHKTKSPKFVTKRPTAAVSNRFDLAHQSMFAAQPSIECYGKTPKKKAAAKENVPAGRFMVPKTKTLAEAKAPTRTPARPIASTVGSVVKSVKPGSTVASKPCTLVVQRSNKKPTQVKEFSLSSNSGKRDGFTFKPYSGPVRPITPGPAVLADKTSRFNIGASNKSASHGSQKLSKKAFHPLEPLGIKAKLASSRAQAARRSAHAQSGKVHREKKIAEARVGCT